MGGVFRAIVGPDRSSARRNQMKLTHKLAIAAGLLFAVSFFLPANGELSGIACLGFCWSVFTQFGQNHDLSLGGWLYYSGFVLANALFLALLGAILLRAPWAKARLLLSAAAMLQVLSWLVVSLVATWNGDKFSLGIGYFAWLLSFLLLFAAHSVAGRVPESLPGPTAEPGAPAMGREPGHP